jgi:thiamine-phosphate pyrophosphorylase
MKLDLRVYVITTSLPRLGRDHLGIAQAAVRGGATVVQFRDKMMTDAEFAATATRLLEITRPAGVPLIINDRVEIAIAVGAAGVHVGQHDAQVREVRRSLPANMIVGGSATNLAEAIEVSDAGADYLGVGPVFSTGSKADATPPMGTEELASICRAVRQPVVAIGGITPQNLEQIIKAGAAGAAVIAAVAEAPDMVGATTELADIWSTGLSTTSSIR